LSQSSHDWLEQSSNLLELAKHAKKLFLEGAKEEKYKLLESVSSNRILTDKKVRFEYKKPFDLLVKGRERPILLQGLYDLRTFFVETGWECPVSLPV